MFMNKIERPMHKFLLATSTAAMIASGVVLLNKNNEANKNLKDAALMTATMSTLSTIGLASIGLQDKKAQNHPEQK